jgi:4-aminobutyrate aminotransferase-like enzyme
MALAQMEELKSHDLIKASAQRGAELLAGLKNIAQRGNSIRRTAVGVGLMSGIELRHTDGTPATAASIQCMKSLLKRGFIVLRKGPIPKYISFTRRSPSPPPKFNAPCAPSMPCWRNARHDPF